MIKFEKYLGRFIWYLVRLQDTYTSVFKNESNLSYIGKYSYDMYFSELH